MFHFKVNNTHILTSGYYPLFSWFQESFLTSTWRFVLADFQKIYPLANNNFSGPLGLCGASNSNHIWPAFANWLIKINVTREKKNRQCRSFVTSCLKGEQHALLQWRDKGTSVIRREVSLQDWLCFERSANKFLSYNK